MTPSQGRFHIVHSEVLRERIRAMLRRALTQSVDRDVAADLRVIQERLARDPVTWGEERGKFVQLGLTVRHMVTDIFHVIFAVNPVERFVLVLNYVPLNAYDFLDEP